MVERDPCNEDMTVTRSYRRVSHSSTAIRPTCYGTAHAYRNHLTNSSGWRRKSVSGSSPAPHRNTSATGRSSRPTFWSPRRCRRKRDSLLRSNVALVSPPSRLNRRLPVAPAEARRDENGSGWPWCARTGRCGTWRTTGARSRSRAPRRNDHGICEAASSAPPAAAAADATAALV